MTLIAITGGAGYIGSMLVPALLRNVNDYHVRVLDDFRYGPLSLAGSMSDPRLEIMVGDARSSDNLRKLVAGADYIIPLAALVGAPLCDRRPREATSINKWSIPDLLMLLSSQQRLVFPNTNSGYGSAEGVCDESTPLVPLSLYARTKAEAEALVMERQNSVVFRLATVFGMSPRMRTDLLVNDFVLRALRDRALVLFEPAHCRNFIHILDVVSAFEHAIDCDFRGMHGEIYNVGLPDANITKLHLCELIAEQVLDFVWTIAEQTSDPDKRDCFVSYDKILRTGWRPVRSLEFGIAELIKGLAPFRQYEYGNV